MVKQKTNKPTAIETVNISAAAVDIGSRMHMAAVNPDVAEMPVRAFETFTHNLHDLADWFKSHGVTSIAMESTGVYWIPAYEILEQHGCFNANSIISFVAFALQFHQGHTPQIDRATIIC